MPDEPTGSKPDGQDTQQLGDADQGQTGNQQDQSVMPTDTGQPTIEEDTAIEKDGQKVVPFDSYKAEKDKRQEYEARIRELEQGQTQQESTGEAEPTPTEEQPFDWDAFLQDVGIQQPNQQSQQPTQPSQPTQPQQSPQTADQIAQINERIAEMRANGDEVGAYMLLRKLENGYVSNMKRTARRWIKDYDNLPLNTVSDDEITAFQQNPEALRGLIAKVRGGGTPKPPTAKPADNGNNAQPANWQQTQEQLRQEGRDEAMRSITSRSGMSGEGARTGNAPPGETYELDDEGKRYMRLRGIPEEKWGEYAEDLHKRMEGRY